MLVKRLLSFIILIILLLYECVLRWEVRWIILCILVSFIRCCRLLVNKWILGIVIIELLWKLRMLFFLIMMELLLKFIHGLRNFKGDFTECISIFLILFFSIFLFLRICIYSGIYQYTLLVCITDCNLRFFHMMLLMFVLVL